MLAMPRGGSFGGGPLKVTTNSTTAVSTTAPSTSTTIGAAIERDARGSATVDIDDEHIAFVAHGTDQLVIPVARELAAEAADLHVDRAVEMLGIHPARQIEQLIAGHHPARMLDEGEQQAELAVGQVDHHVFGIDQLPPDRIEPPAREAQMRPFARRGARAALVAAQHRADSREQFAWVGGLG